LSDKIHKIVKRLHFILKWTQAHPERALLYAEDLSVFICHHHHFEPKPFRKLHEINCLDCCSWFGLNHHDVKCLFSARWIPREFRASSDQVFVVTLFHLVKGTPYTKMAWHTFDGDPRDFSKMYDLMINHLYFNFFHKISGRSLSQWIPAYLHDCQRLIFDA
jgi:hypothetical protein